jgi:hypothetical protein
MNNDEVNKVKDMLIEIMLTGQTSALFSRRFKYNTLIHDTRNGWELTTAGRKWLEQQAEKKN